MKIGFDNEKYINLQSAKIRERIDMFGGKLYMEFGGKLFDDYHAARVLPGFEPDAKVKMLLELKDDAEIVIVINADAIEKNKTRGDLGITYDLDTLRLIDAFREIGLYVGSVVITCYMGQPSAQAFEKRLEALGIKVYKHYQISDYLGVAARVEYCAVKLKLLAELCKVYKAAVKGNCYSALDMVNNYRLAVEPSGVCRRSVTHVTDSHSAFAERL